ncbi:hypothetical protein LXL04_010124 [Taraxacum kok-saghyz]
MPAAVRVVHGPFLKPPFFSQQGVLPMIGLVEGDTFEFGVYPGADFLWCMGWHRPRLKFVYVVQKNTQLLEYMDALSPCDSFVKFDKTKLLNLSKLYKNDFNDLDIRDLEGQLEIYYHSCIRDERFINLNEISDLCSFDGENGATPDRVPRSVGLGRRDSTAAFPDQANSDLPRVVVIKRKL